MTTFFLITANEKVTRPFLAGFLLKILHTQEEEN